MAITIDRVTVPAGSVYPHYDLADGQVHVAALGDVLHFEGADLVGVESGGEFRRARNLTPADLDSLRSIWAYTQSF